MVQPGQWLLTATRKYGDSVFCRGYDVPIFFRNLQSRFLTCWKHDLLDLTYSTSSHGGHRVTTVSMVVSVTGFIH